MATNPNTTANLQDVAKLQLRMQMEQLLESFYSAVGIAPRQDTAAIAGDLLAGNFEGRFFMRTTSELLCFDRSQMLTVRLGMGDVRPTSRLLALKVAGIENGCVSAAYSVAFRYGQTAIIHRGTLKAVRDGERWVVRSIDEDVRVKLLPERRFKHRGPSDLPRVWIR